MSQFKRNFEQCVWDNWQQFQNCQPNITESKTFSSIYQHSKNAMLWSPKLQLALLQMEQHRWRVSFKKSPTNYGNGNSNNHCSCCRLFRVSERHSLDIKPLCLIKLSGQTLGNLPCFLNKTTQIIVFFNFLLLIFFKAFCWTISLRIKFFFLKSGGLKDLNNKI